MTTDKIVIEQTLHGYSSGHKLLASSAEISTVERRIMQNMSDYSGSGLEKNFSSYLTGYPLGVSKFFVFAKTWYAEEMKRPGCVWTHSLLINFTDLLAIQNMRALLSYFERPTEVNFKNYHNKIFIENFEEKDNRLSKTFFGLCQEVYNEEGQSVLLLADSSDDYQKEILQIWDWQWPRLKRNFVFCTGSLSIRKFEEIGFDLQVFPVNRWRTVTQRSANEYKIADLTDNIKLTPFGEALNLTDFSELYSFLIRYGSDVNGKRTNFKPLFEVFSAIKKPRDITISWIINFFDSNFTEPDEGKMLKSLIIETYANNSIENKFELLKLLLSQKSLSTIKWNLVSIIKSFWALNQLTDIEFVRIIKDLIVAKYDDIAVELLSDVPINLWIAGNFKQDIYIKLLDINPLIENEAFIWTQDEDFQRKWFSILKKCRNTNWQHVLYAMLEANSDMFVNELHELLQIEIMQPIVLWITKNEMPLSFKWRSILVKNQTVFFACLMEQNKFSKNALKLAVEILNPTDPNWRSLQTSNIESFVFNISKTKFELEITGIFTILISACYTNNLNNPPLISSIIFQKLHDALAKGVCDRNSWEKFRLLLGSDVNTLSVSKYMFSFWGRDNTVQEWDRCEFLRRAFLVGILKFDWNPMIIISTIKDPNTFQQFAKFAIDLSFGESMFKYMFEEMDLVDRESSFHFKIIQMALKNR